MREIDRKLSRLVQLECTGGFVLTLLHDVPRVTGDLDYLETMPNDATQELEQIAGRNSVLCKQTGLFVQYVPPGIIFLPDDYRSRLRPLELHFNKLKLLALDPYDLALTKVSRNSLKDREDVKFLAEKENLEYAVFVARWESEMQTWVPNRDRDDLTVQLWKEYFPR